MYQTLTSAEATEITAPRTFLLQEGRLRQGLPQRLTMTVPKEFVHRAAVAEVFLTGWSRQDDSHFSVTAQWPRGHSFFTHVDGMHDPMLAAETIRQTGALLAHAEFDVPLGHHFLMWDLQYRPVPQHMAVGATPADLSLDVTCTDIRRRGRKLAGLRYEVVIRCREETVATGGAYFTCTTPEVYRRLRAGKAVPAARTTRMPVPVAPDIVGRHVAADVVLSPTRQPNRWQLRADTSHAILFDHPVDHVPGMVLLEAARQAVRAVDVQGDLLLAPLTSTFNRYAELNAPCWITAHPAHTGDGRLSSVEVVGIQEDEPVFTCTFGNKP